MRNARSHRGGKPWYHVDTNPVTQAYLRKLEDLVQGFSKPKLLKDMTPEDWAEITQKLPHAPTAEEKEKRRLLFAQIDTDHDSLLTFDEVKSGILLLLGLDGMFDATPAIAKAFDAAKGVGHIKALPPASRKSRVKGKPESEDTVEINEFRLLLSYVRQYFELFAMFQRVDTSEDKMIDLDEFKEAVEKISHWGLEIEDPEDEFQTIDVDGGGAIAFDEFADWALRMKLDLDDDDDDPN